MHISVEINVLLRKTRQDRQTNQQVAAIKAANRRGREEQTRAGHPHLRAQSGTK